MKAGMKVVMEGGRDGGRDGGREVGRQREAVRGAGRQRRQGPGQEAWNEATECQLIYNVIDS